MSEILNQTSLPVLGGYDELKPDGKSWPKMRISPIGRGSSLGGYAAIITGSRRDPIVLDIYYDYHRKDARINYLGLGVMAQQVLGTDCDEAKNFMFTQLIQFFQQECISEVSITDGQKVVSIQKVKATVQQGERPQRPSPN